MYTLKFGGRVIEGLQLSGNTFMRNEPIDGVPEGMTLRNVTVEFTPEQEGENPAGGMIEPGEYGYMTVVRSDGKEPDGKYRLALEEMSREELREIETDSKIEYIAMMSGVEL